MRLKTVFRSLVKDRLFSALNIVGFSVGLSAVIAIIILVRLDLSYDDFHVKRDRIYRLIANATEKANPRIESAVTPFPFGPALLENFTSVERAIRFRQAYQVVVSNGTTAFKEPAFYFVEPEVFDVFDFELTKGNKAAVLREPNTVVITESTALRLFGAVDPIGQTIIYSGSGGARELHVTGVLAPLPFNTHFQFDYLASMNSLDTSGAYWTNWPSLWTYLLIREGTDIHKLNADVTSFINSRIPEQEKLPASQTIVTGLEPLSDIQLHSHLRLQMKPVSDIANVYLLSSIAALIMLMMCFNFIGLATARSLTRIKEVAIRKIVGAGKLQLMGRFLGETLILSVIGVIISLVLVQLLAHPLSLLTGRPIAIDLTEPWLWVMLTATIAFVTLASGIYPAFLLAGFNPTGLSQSLRPSGDRLTLRKSLVVVQFSIAALMIFCAALVSEQMSFVRKKNLGADIDQIVYVPAIRDAVPFMVEALREPFVIAATQSSRLPANEESFDSRPVLVEGFMEPQQLESFNIDEEFVNTFGIELVAGRNLTNREDTLNAGFLLNESAVRFLGWESPEAALGKSLGWQFGEIKGKVVGVVRDFNLGSLHAKIGPLIMLYNNSFEFISLKVRPDENLNENLKKIERMWKTHAPEGGYTLTFARDSFLQLHDSEARLSWQSKIFTAIAMLIAALGLFGFANYVVIERTKELAIRKVLGATVTNLLGWLNAHFLLPAAVGAIIVMPIMYAAADKWLGNFSYRITLSWKYFALALGTALLLAMVTVTYRSIAAIFENPVKALKEM